MDRAKVRVMGRAKVRVSLGSREAWHEPFALDFLAP